MNVDASDCVHVMNVDASDCVQVMNVDASDCVHVMNVDASDCVHVMNVDASDCVHVMNVDASDCFQVIRIKIVLVRLKNCFWSHGGMHRHTSMQTAWCQSLKISLGMWTNMINIWSKFQNKISNGS